jgi:dolichyl-phosphate-mannose--protein O-mannosyl transferase
MAEWLGQLLANAPVWVVLIVGLIAAVIVGFFWILPVGFEFPGPKSEWQKSWYKKKEVKKHGKK